jgi:hypothetical protein
VKERERLAKRMQSKKKKYIHSLIAADADGTFLS